MVDRTVQPAQTGSRGDRDTFPGGRRRLPRPWTDVNLFSSASTASSRCSRPARRGRDLAAELTADPNWARFPARTTTSSVASIWAKPSTAKLSERRRREGRHGRHGSATARRIPRLYQVSVPDRSDSRGWYMRIAPTSIASTMTFTMSATILGDVRAWYLTSRPSRSPAVVASSAGYGSKTGVRHRALERNLCAGAAQLLFSTWIAGA